MVILADLRGGWSYGESAGSRNPPNAALFVRPWRDFFKEALTSLPPYAEHAAETLCRWYFDEAGTPWNKVYDFVEFIGDLQDNLRENAAIFRTICNAALNRECSAYRFVGKVIAPITNDAEINAIEQAATTDNDALRPVNTHIDAALRLLAHRDCPDYRNSMKESISAVEAVCKIISKKHKATLSPALGAVAAKIDLHPDLQKGFKALYGYTSDEHGIRHALKDDGQPEEEDARYFLVSCSAFVNFLVEKARKNGLLA
jgi:hypothetical protein